MLELTGGEGVDAIFDGVGKNTGVTFSGGLTNRRLMGHALRRFEADLKMIRIGGTLVSLGEACGPIPPVSPRKLSERSINFTYPR